MAFGAESIGRLVRLTLRRDGRKTASTDLSRTQAIEAVQSILRAVVDLPANYDDDAPIHGQAALIEASNPTFSTNKAGNRFQP